MDRICRDRLPTVTAAATPGFRVGPAALGKGACVVAAEDDWYRDGGQRPVARDLAYFWSDFVNNFKRLY